MDLYACLRTRYKSDRTRFVDYSFMLFLIVIDSVTFSSHTVFCRVINSCLSSPSSLCVDDSSDGSLSPMASSCEDLSRPTPPMFSLLASSDSTNEVERSTSPMFVDEHDEEPPMVSRRPTRTLAKTLVQIHSMISEAEQEAELNHRISGRLSPLHENTELVTSGTWNSAVRLRSFSTASSQSSPLTPCSSKSSLSPGSPSFLNSPHSSPGGPDTTEFQEFISSSRKLLERDLSDLALTGEPAHNSLSGTEIY